MAKQVEDVIVGGTNQDLAFEMNGTWHEPKKGQAALVADKKEPFISAIVKGNKIVVLGVDSFQSPTATKKLTVRLPDGDKNNYLTLWKLARFISRNFEKIKLQSRNL